MAKQIGIVKITGTIDDITFYKMGDTYYARMKSSLTGKRFWNDKAFAGSRRSANAFGIASKLASILYRTLPKEQKGRPVYQKLTGQIKFLVLEGKDSAAITIWFQQAYSGSLTIEKWAKEKEQESEQKKHAFFPAMASFDKEIIKLHSDYERILRDMHPGVVESGVERKNTRVRSRE